MLDTRVLDLLATSLEADCYQRQKRVEKRIAQVQAEAGRNGLLRSSTVVLQTGHVFDEELEAWGWLAWNTLARIVLQLAVPPAPDLPTDLQTAVDTHLLPLARDFDTRLTDLQNRINIQTNRTIDEALDAMRKKLAVEAHLLVSQLATQQRLPGSSHTTQIFNAPVGAVQIGFGATAKVSQSLDAHAKGAILAALAEVLEVVKQNQVLPEAQTAELVGVVEEARHELSSPEPNSMRAKALVLAAATTIQTVGSLRPAYEMLKRSLSLIGIALP